MKLKIPDVANNKDTPVLPVMCINLKVEIITIMLNQITGQLLMWLCYDYFCPEISFSFSMFISMCMYVYYT